MVDFLLDRKHRTRYAGQQSVDASINASVVQGSGFGPSAYVVVASDLHPVHDHNVIVKFADDTLVPGSKRDTINKELEGIQHDRSITSSLILTNLRKCCSGDELELSFYLSLYLGLNELTLIVIGVNISYDFRASAHVDRLLGRCTSSLHALRILRAHGLPQDALHNVAKATLLSRLLYASPSWWGMTSADERLKIERFINKSRRLGYLPANQPTMETMTDEADRRLLRAVVTCNNHVLMCLFPPIQATQYNLRPRAHNFKLPEKDNINFISRILFKR